MAKSLQPIPSGVAITDGNGIITIFFRLAWQALVDSFTLSPSVGSLQKLNQNAALVTTAVFTTRTAGWYRLSYYLRKTFPDGVSSSAQVTFGWSESGVPLTETDTAIVLDSSVTGQRSGRKEVWADGGVDLTIAVAYASNTPGRMIYRLDATAEQFA